MNKHPLRNRKARQHQASGQLTHQRRIESALRDAGGGEHGSGGLCRKAGLPRLLALKPRQPGFGLDPQLDQLGADGAARVFDFPVADLADRGLRAATQGSELGLRVPSLLE